MADTTRHCANPRCGNPLPGTRRAQARTCSTRCRVAVHRATKHTGLPAELTTRARWVRASPTRRPLQLDGTPASSTDPTTWTTYNRARAYTGKGFVLNGDGLVVVDLDHCIRPDGSLEPWAEEIVAAAPATYTEISPSGTGLHLWGTGALERGRRIRRADGAQIEAYGDGRYITVTGTRYANAPNTLADLSGLLHTIL